MIRIMIAPAPKDNAQPVQISKELTPTNIPKKVKTVNFKNTQFAYDFFTVADPATLSLTPNFTHPKDAETIRTENNCKSVINGGFYDKQSKPLGYFRIGDSVLGPKIDSDLVNGFFWSDASGSAVISTELPNATYNFALQSGPVLLFGGDVLPLSIHNDQPARRMAVARSADNRLIFLTVYSEQAVFEGPNLADLPDIIMSISNQEHLSITDALNLDGGSASAFYSGETRLSELTPVGSLFCVK
jgi:uncharacterized protein YigE (DUF2233 family)